MSAPLSKPVCTLRLARGSDIQQIAVMSRCLIEVGLRGWTWHPTRIARALRSRETCVLVAGIEDRLAGFAITEFGDTRAHLSLLAVQPAHQRQGIGLTMIEWIMESALTAGITRIDVEMRSNNFAARSFYEALGFVLTGQVAGYYQNIETAVRMQRRLGSMVASPEQ
jgi:ribosomal protein S18 acetylase RimI-like enzyme